MSRAAWTVVVELPPELDVPATMAPLGRWGDDGIDRWAGERSLRTIRVGSRAVAYLARSTGTIQRPALEVTTALGDRGPVSEAVAGMFVSGGDAFAALVDSDARIARLDAAYPGVRPLLHRDPLTALVRSISAQQVNLRWAAEIRRRLAIAYGTLHAIDGHEVRSLEAGPLAEASVADLRALQLTTAKAHSIIAVARAVRDGDLELAELEALADEALMARLVALPGIGPWTADWFLARTLGRPRVVAGDLGVRKAVGRAYLGGRLPSEAEVRAVTAYWGAAAGVAQQLALNDLAMGPPPSSGDPPRRRRPRVA